MIPLITGSAADYDEFCRQVGMPMSAARDAEMGLRTAAHRCFCVGKVVMPMSAVRDADMGLRTEDE